MNRDEFPVACHDFGKLCREVCVCGVCRACSVWLCLLCVLGHVLVLLWRGVIGVVCISWVVCVVRSDVGLMLVMCLCIFCLGWLLWCVCVFAFCCLVCCQVILFCVR